jgi:hypothetical protein
VPEKTNRNLENPLIHNIKKITNLQNIIPHIPLQQPEIYPQNTQAIPVQIGLQENPQITQPPPVSHINPPIPPILNPYYFLNPHMPMWKPTTLMHQAPLPPWRNPIQQYTKKKGISYI